MTDEKVRTDLKEQAFAARPERRDSLTLLARDSKGKLLFMEHESPVPFKVSSWEPYNPSGSKPQIAYVITEPSGKEYIFPIGKTNQYVISDMGITDPDQLIGAVFHIETYETGSTGIYAVGKRIAKIVLAESAKK